MNNKELLITLLNQEKELQFDTFTMATAHAIGLNIMATANAAKYPVAIDITRHGQQLFHVALEGSSKDNDSWIKRKNNLVNQISHSSFYMSTKLAISGKTIEEALLLKESEYAPHGGSFPIIIKGSGVIGTITVSGLASADDHLLVVNAIKEYLNSEV